MSKGVPLLGPRSNVAQARCQFCGGWRDPESLLNGACVRCRIERYEAWEAERKAALGRSSSSAQSTEAR